MPGGTAGLVGVIPIIPFLPRQGWEACQESGLSQPPFQCPAVPAPLRGYPCGMCVHSTKKVAVFVDVWVGSI